MKKNYALQLYASLSHVAITNSKTWKLTTPCQPGSTGDAYIQHSLVSSIQYPNKCDTWSTPPFLLLSFGFEKCKFFCLFVFRIL